MPTRTIGETETGGVDENTNKPVRVTMGFDVQNPLVGDVGKDDTFETLLSKVTEGTDMNARELRNGGYSPIVGGRAYSYTDNVMKAMAESNSKEVTFMTKQKGRLKNMGILGILDKSILLVSKNLLYSAKPLTTIAKFKEQILSTEVESKPLLFFDGFVYELNSFTTTDTLLNEIRREVSLRYEEEYSDKVGKFLNVATEVLTKNTAGVLSSNRVYPIVYDNRLLLCKEILPYTIKDDKIKYDFTGCTIYVQMGNNGQYNPPAVLETRQYHHPHVFEGNLVCLGSYKNKLERGIVGAVKALNQTEQILVSGYSYSGRIPGKGLCVTNYPNKKGGFD